MPVEKTGLLAAMGLNTIKIDPIQNPVGSH